MKNNILNLAIVLLWAVRSVASEPAASRIFFSRTNDTGVFICFENELGEEVIKAKNEEGKRYVLERQKTDPTITFSKIEKIFQYNLYEVSSTKSNMIWSFEYTVWAGFGLEPLQIIDVFALKDKKSYIVVFRIDVYVFLECLNSSDKGGRPSYIIRQTWNFRDHAHIFGEGIYKAEFEQLSSPDMARIVLIRKKGDKIVKVWNGQQWVDE